MKRAIAFTLLCASFVIGTTATPASAKTGPKSCIQALDAADDVNDAMIVFTDALSAYFSKVETAARSASPTLNGLVGLIETQTAALNSLNSTVESQTPAVREARSRYVAASSKCRAGK